MQKGIVTEAEGFDREWPAEGWVDATCCEFADLGFAANPYKKTKEHPDGILEHQGVLIFQLSELNSLGRRMEIRFYFKMSFGRKGYRSNLFKYLQKWRGKAFSEKELKGFNIFSVVGKPCQVLVAHIEDEEGVVVRTKLAGIRPAKVLDMEPLDYVDLETRQEQRADNVATFQDFSQPVAGEVEQIPF